MLARELKRFALTVGPTLMFLLLTVQYWRSAHQEQVSSQINEWLTDKGDAQIAVPPSRLPPEQQQPPEQEQPTKPASDLTTTPLEDQPQEAYSPSDSHHVLHSLSTPNRQFFQVKFGQYEAINPNIIPRHGHEDEYIIVAQKNQTFALSPYFSEVACVAQFTTPGVLDCIHLPFMLPIAATFGDACPEDIKFMEYSVGPHDARVFWGPEKPFVMWQSTSRHTCISQWMQDFRLLFDWGYHFWDPTNFFMATEIMRPKYDSPIEKNWFVFWDKDNQLYAHYDIFPKRSFAKVATDGSVGQDLAPLAKSDKECLVRLMPKFELPEPAKESVHQATNSLSITMCKRAEPSCVPTDANTFLFTVFHHKQYIDMASYYEPYVMMWQNRAPFEVYGVSNKPLWIHGRKKGEKHTQMFFIVSMSWKAVNQTYHGYLDDEMFLSIGIEDKAMGGIDVKASDLLYDMRHC